MRIPAIATLLILPVLVLLATAVPGAAPPISVSAQWARATPPVATTGAVYLRIESEQADTLLAASTTAAERVEIHVTNHAAGLMQMRPVTGVAVGPDTVVALAPGGMHLMLLDLKGPLVAGSAIDLLLRFAKAGELPVRVPVLRDAPAAP